MTEITITILQSEESDFEHKAKIVKKVSCVPRLHEIIYLTPEDKDILEKQMKENIEFYKKILSPPDYEPDISDYIYVWNVIHKIATNTIIVVLNNYYKWD